jgi:hypothetical protein
VRKNGPVGAAGTRAASDFKFELSFKAAYATSSAQTGIDISSGALTNEHLGNTDTLLKPSSRAALRIHHLGLRRRRLSWTCLTMKHRVYYAHVIGKALEATQPDYAELEAVVAELQSEHAGRIGGWTD